VRAAASIFVIVLSIGIAWVNTDAAKYCWLLLALAPWAADRWLARRARPDAGRPGRAGGAR
jgi:hypothetical protein